MWVFLITNHIKDLIIRSEVLKEMCIFMKGHGNKILNIPTYIGVDLNNILMSIIYTIGGDMIYLGPSNLKGRGNTFPLGPNILIGPDNGPFHNVSHLRNG